MPIKKEHMDTINGCTDKLFSLFCWTSEIADSLERIGLPIHEEIRQISNTLSKMQDEMGGVVGKILSSDIKEAGERSVTILKAALAGIEIAKQRESSEKE